MQIVQYPHPILSTRAKPVERVDAALRQTVAAMLELMYKHEGCGLAGNQVDFPYRLFVMNETGKADQPEFERVFINPVLNKPKGTAEAEEGCLSLPGLYAPVKRPERISITGYDLSGQQVTIDATGLVARIVQHEADHLDGILIIDRLSPTARMAVRDLIEEFERKFQGQAS